VRARAGPAASSARWNTFESHLKKWVKSEKDDDAKKGLLLALDKIVLALTYPRLDEAVSTHRNHLLKSPFVVHPKTGKVCVPIFDVANCHLFDPDAVPNLATLIEEIDDGARRPLSGGEVGAADNNNPPESKRSKLARPVTKLDAFVRRFEHDFLRPMREQREQAEEAAAKATRAAKKDLGERQAAATGAW
jgi:DNA primase catalytic subunit